MQFKNHMEMWRWQESLCSNKKRKVLNELNYSEMVTCNHKIRMLNVIFDRNEKPALDVLVNF